MGQPVGVVRSRTLEPAGSAGTRRIRYELDRSLSGMGHEVYRSAESITGDRPPDVLARELFATGSVASVSIFTNVVTVEIAPGCENPDAEEIVTGLFIHYRPGVLPSAI